MAVTAQKALDLWSSFEKLFNNKNGRSDSRRFASMACATKALAEIIVEENYPGCNGLGTTFAYFKSKGLLKSLFEWCRSYENCTKESTFLLLDFYRLLFGTASTAVLRDSFILTSFNRLLIDLRPKDKQKLPLDVELSLLSVVEGFISRLTLDPNLLKCCNVEERTQSGVFLPKYTFFSTILYYIYIEGELGCMARKMLVECIKLSSSDVDFADFIGMESSCCAILAAGLSGLFSSLPTSFTIENKDWCGIGREDCALIPGLNQFLEALDMCCMVARVKQGNIAPSLIRLIHDGFLISVLTPALFQSGVESKTSTIAYVDLLLRTISEPEMLKIFLKWILLESYEDYSILDLLISHLYLPSIHLCMVTIHLFRTLMELNCEDVMYHLILRYLIPCYHILPNQKRKIKELDFYCKSANMFLYLTPMCCLDAVDDEEPAPTENGTDTDGQTISNDADATRSSSLVNFDEYLHDSRATIGSCRQACTCWTSVYDGTDVMTEYPSRMSRCASDSSSSGDVAAPEQAAGSYKELLLLPDNVSTNSQTTDCLGPFLNAIFDKLEKMPETNPYINLQLTALVSRMACYPQPLLRSFLLSSTVVLQQGVRSLIQTVTAVSHRANTAVTALASYRDHLRHSRAAFIQRASCLPSPGDDDQPTNDGTLSPGFEDPSLLPNQMEYPNEEHSRPVSSRTFSLTSDEPDSDACVTVSFSSQPKAVVGRLHPVIRYGPKDKLDTARAKQKPYRKPDVATKNILYCAIILEEWLQELAAISLEHNLV